MRRRCYVRHGILPVAYAVLAAASSPVAAHEIPADVAVQGFVKPEGRQLRVLLRLPLGALRDVDFPTRGAGYLDLARAEEPLDDAVRLWIADGLELYEGDQLLEPPRLLVVRVSLPSDRSFGSWEEALAHVTGPRLAPDTEIAWNQALVDVLLESSARSERSRFSIRTPFARLGLRVVTTLRFVPPGGAVRAFELTGDPGLVPLDPSWLQAALRFVVLGFWHILEGTDHVLFLLCLVIPVRRFRTLAVIVTSFTLAHSITLAASALGLAPGSLWFPPLIETLIAISIVYLALENIVAPHVEQRWRVAFGFGLVHGFGFAFGLQETRQFAGSHLVTSLLSFNVGVELGQLLALALLVPLLTWFFRRVPSERVAAIVLSALVAHTGWHWMVERAERLRQFRFEWPAFDDAAWLAGLTLWLLLGVAAAGLAWLVFSVWLSKGRGPDSTRRRATDRGSE